MGDTTSSIVIGPNLHSLLLTLIHRPASKDSEPCMPTRPRDGTGRTNTPESRVHSIDCSLPGLCVSSMHHGFCEPVATSGMYSCNDLRNVDFAALGEQGRIMPSI